MRKLFLRTVAVLCATVLIFTAAACQTGRNAETGTEGGGTGAESGKKVVFNIYKNFSAPEYPADGGKAKPMILEALAKAGIKNVDFNVTLASGTEYFTKLSTFAAANELPDFFNLNEDTLMRFSDQGLLLKLDAYMNTSPNLLKVLNKEDLATLRMNDVLYAIPIGYRTEAYNGSSTSALVARQDWLDKLGLKKPTTLEEYYEVLKAFTTKDPDGNGKNDTYGLGASKDTLFASIQGAFGVYCDFWFERDGMVKAGSVLPEMKEALAVLQKWYKEGLIDPDFPVTESKAAQEKFVNARVGAYHATAMSVSPENPDHAALKKITPGAKITIFAPPKGPKGFSGWAENVSTYKSMLGASAKCQNPELLFKFLDWSTDDGPNGGFYLLTYGIEGEHYKYIKEKNLIDQSMVSYSDLYKLGFSNPVRFVQVVDRRWMSDEAKEAMSLANTAIIKSKFNKLLPVMSEYPDLKKTYTEYFIKIITGALPADAYDEYVKKYYEKGGKKIEEAVNAEYKKMK